MSTRKELLKLSKPQLIKQCKKYKLSTLGNKNDMITRILDHNKDKPVKTSKKIASPPKAKGSQVTSSNKTNNNSYVQLVYGYCRPNLTESPPELLQLFSQFYYAMYLAKDGLDLQLKFGSKYSEISKYIKLDFPQPKKPKIKPKPVPVCSYASMLIEDMKGNFVQTNN